MPEKSIIGRDVYVDIIGSNIMHVPAKVDTGADGSAIWASDIFVDESGALHFKLFGKGSEYYTGEDNVTHEYSVSLTKSASGNVVMKYRVKIPIRIGGRRIKATLGLSDRATHNYPILIGRRTLHGKFVVDVTEQTEAAKQIKKVTPPHLNDQMRKDPYKFYKEQYLNDKRSK